jgi:hypothetical protein
MNRQLKTLALLATAAFAFVAMSPSQAKADTTDEQVVTIGFETANDATPVTRTPSHDDFGPEVSVFARQRGVASAPLPPAVVSGAFLLASNFVVTRLWKKRKI